MSEVSISVVMPNYNGEKYLRLALDSFLEERYGPKELIVVDGKSTDGSHRILAEYTEKSADIKWLRVQDSGISDAINRAIDVAEGEIIGYLGSDDRLSGDVFQTIARWAPYVDFDAIYFNSYTYYVNERRCLLQRPVVPEITFEALLSNGTIVGLQNTYYRRRVFDSFRFNVANRYSMDYELLLEVARSKGMFLHIDQVATLNYFDGNISHNNDAQALEAAYVARRFCGTYEGRLFGEERLPEEDRRRPPEPPAQPEGGLAAESANTEADSGGERSEPGGPSVDDPVTESGPSAQEAGVGGSTPRGPFGRAVSRFFF